MSSPVRCRGFALGELIVVLLIAGLVGGAVLAALIALIRSLQPQSVRIDGDIVPIAPTFAVFPSALRLHERLAERIATARAVYVFGGSHLSIGSAAPLERVRPLAVRAVPHIDNFSSGLPLDARTFYGAYAGQLGPEESSPISDQDFTVLVVGVEGGLLAVTCCVQVRRKPDASTASDGRTCVQREVLLWDLDGTTARYAFAEPLAVADKLFVGAVHSWLRYRTGAVAEEGPVSLVFPDPWVYGGRRLQEGAVPAFSRFRYFVPVSR